MKDGTLASRDSTTAVADYFGLLDDKYGNGF
jgi:hypothetical protein